jgi:predicted aminopeptidase
MARTTCAPCFRLFTHTLQAAVRTAVALSSALLLSGCYYAELAGLQLSLINEQRPIAEAVAAESRTFRRALLGMVPEIRSFARNTVQLPVGPSYRGYYPTEAKGILFVVVGSERLRLQPYTWWFPVVGTAAYKSFTDETSAQSEAQRLERAGFDAWVGRVTAYSSLGFFRDPVTTVMMQNGVVGFVEVLLHEMAHMRLYVPGHTDFNEQLASFVGQVAAEQFLRSRHGHSPAVMGELQRHIRQRERLDALVRERLAALEMLYAGSESTGTKLELRAGMFARLQADLIGLYPEREPRELIVNNARMLQYRRYIAGTERMRPFWTAAGGSWPRFWRLIEAHASTQL